MSVSVRVFLIVFSRTKEEYVVKASQSYCTDSAKSLPNQSADVITETSVGGSILMLVHQHKLPSIRMSKSKMMFLFQIFVAEK